MRAWESDVIEGPPGPDRGPGLARSDAMNMEPFDDPFDGGPAGLFSPRYKLCIVHKPVDASCIKSIYVLDPALFPTYERQGFEVLAIGDCDPRLHELVIVADHIEFVPDDRLPRIRELLARPEPAP
jgi:hypothetical protein